jgi:hypothetical protein
VVFRVGFSALLDSLGVGEPLRGSENAVAIGVLRKLRPVASRELEGVTVGTFRGGMHIMNAETG